MFFFIQIAVVFYAWFSAAEEAAWSWGYRNYMMDADKKNKQLDIAHDAGAAAVVCILILVSTCCGLYYAFFFWQRIWVFLLSFAVNGFWYWLVFDIRFAKKIGMSWDYIGDTADTDNKLIRMFGKNAGEIKAIICCIMIIVFNIIFLLL